jgi:hypothetical protein
MKNQEPHLFGRLKSVHGQIDFIYQLLHNRKENEEVIHEVNLRIFCDKTDHLLYRTNLVEGVSDHEILELNS